MIYFQFIQKSMCFLKMNLFFTAFVKPTLAIEKKLSPKVFPKMFNIIIEPEIGFTSPQNCKYSNYIQTHKFN